MHLLPVSASRKSIHGDWEEFVALATEFGGVEGDASLLHRLWAASGPLSASCLRRIANATPLDIGVAQTLARRKRQAVALQLAAPTDSSFTELGASGLPARLPPTKLKRPRLLEGDPQARAKREKALREEWIPQLLELVTAAQLPMIAVASASSNPTLVCAAIGQASIPHVVRPPYTPFNWTAFGMRGPLVSSSGFAIRMFFRQLSFVVCVTELLCLQSHVLVSTFMAS